MNSATLQSTSPLPTASPTDLEINVADASKHLMASGLGVIADACRAELGFRTHMPLIPCGPQCPLLPISPLSVSG